ncbi:hypothetical protein [Candidatus Methylacidithermus pantelleriae]|uniref:Uncharacterized protein n=1 Tax=Candidatus Methylacidithermus pantelleriae TaxID=2744239 RepID=A0A8J2BSW0_9BACT|nr:hypothetical protein [Candidatus Methylacidithermus pantelleriae]CAF0696140.1 hypothetical protein MPNT_20128 [Candidatus Methylacidithermus pantelleriae]
MFPLPSHEQRVAELFLERLRCYLTQIGRLGFPPVRLRIRKRCGEGILGGFAEVPRAEAAYLFSREVLQAMERAVEDLAADSPRGRFYFLCGSFDDFFPYRERYVQLAQRLGTVRVFGSGDVPEDCPGIEFLTCDPRKLSRYRLVLLEGPKRHATVFCRRALTGSCSDGKEVFVGFYSVNPIMTSFLRWWVQIVPCGVERVLEQWEKPLLLPEVSPAELERFLRECNGR